MKCPVAIANELSGLTGMGYELATQTRMCANLSVSRYRSGAGNEIQQNVLRATSGEITWNKSAQIIGVRDHAMGR